MKPCEECGSAKEAIAGVLLAHKKNCPVLDTYPVYSRYVVEEDPVLVRTFNSGATRNTSDNKFDYEGFINPGALFAYAEYMHSHRLQRDGSLRDSDNWQKGIPLKVYMKSLLRHTIDLWRLERGFTVIDPDTGHQATRKDLLCAILFNALGFLKEEVDPAEINGES